MLEKRLIFPCPKCGGVVLSNGYIQCQKCHHEWQGTDYTSPGGEFYGEVISREGKKLDFLVRQMENHSAQLECENPEAVVEQSDLATMQRNFALAITHLGNITRAMSAMDNYIAERM